MPPRAPRVPSRRAIAVAGALLAAVSTFVLPAAELPGGAIVWQVAALALALGGAWWCLRQFPTEDRSARTRLGRLVAGAAAFIALLWVAGVALLWLIWPR